MALLSKIKAVLTLDNKDYKKGLKDAEKQTQGFGKQMQKMGGIIAGAFAVKVVADFAKAALKAYDIQIQAETKLLTALKGRTDVQKRLIKQAGQLQLVTLFGDEATIEAQAMLASLGLNEKAIWLLKQTWDWCRRLTLLLSQWGHLLTHCPDME